MVGYFSIGKFNNIYHREEIAYLNMEIYSFFSSLYMDKILVNDQKMYKYEKNEYWLITDSANTIFYFIHKIFNEKVEKNN